MEIQLPPIPAKRYFTIGEVGELCGVKPHVLRYWEQEFTQLRPMKRRGTRRYYQHHEVLMIRRIRELLYDQGFTISGARNKLQELTQLERDRRRGEDTAPESVAPGIGGMEVVEVDTTGLADGDPVQAMQVLASSQDAVRAMHDIRAELLSIRELLAQPVE
jgi:DNA-binding transcriptional MerR regulator